MPANIINNHFKRRNKMTPYLIQSFARKAVKKKITKWLIDLSLVPLALPLLIIRYVFHLKFFRVHGNRFGHLAMNNETFLRKRQLGLIKEKNVKYIGIVPTKVCNQQLLDMYKRHLTIFQIPQPRLVRTITKIMAEKSILSRLDLFVVLEYDLGYFLRFNEAKPIISFTEQEKLSGKELLEKMGINKGDWFICFHVRDEAYVNSLLKKGDSRYTYRNSTLKNIFPALEYVTTQGGYTLRMGAKVHEKIPELHNQKIIDYSTLYRTGLGDIYLPAKCKFFVGTGSGVASIAEIFNVPEVRINFVPLNPLIPDYTLNHFPPGKMDLFIPKKIWSKEKKRFLTFKEELEFDLNFTFDTEDYEKAGLVPVENTAEEILAVTKEMNQRLEETWKSKPEDEELQRRFRALFTLEGKPYNFPARIGAQFLRENEELLD